ncbi:MAG: nuclear transport factor 2 family protein [Candidatus Omnitrophica bacterium]|nr:nuclear transport factor 2 family protein [Candidatus Omnitrophota bacterium]
MRKKKKSILKILVFVILAAGVSYGVKIVFFPDQVAKIHKTISMAVDEIESKDVSSFIRHFTLDYRDCFDNTYGTLYIFLKNNIDMFKRINIGMSQMEVEIDKQEATVKFLATATVVSSEGEIYKEAGRFILKMRKEDFRWKIYRLDEMGYDFD